MCVRKGRQGVQRHLNPAPPLQQLTVAFINSAFNAVRISAAATTKTMWRKSSRNLKKSGKWSGRCVPFAALNRISADISRFLVVSSTCWNKSKDVWQLHCWMNNNQLTHGCFAGCANIYTKWRITWISRWLKQVGPHYSSCPRGPLSEMTDSQGDVSQSVIAHALKSWEIDITKRWLIFKYEPSLNV